MPYGDPQPLPLAQVMGPKAAIWERLSARHGLVPHRWAELVDRTVVGANLAREHESLVDILKCRRFGFNDFEDSEAMLEAEMRQLMAQRIIPPV